MSKTYRIAQQWNDWLTQFLGKSLLEYEQKAMVSMQAGKYGNSCVVIGVPNHESFLQTSFTSNHFLLSPIHNQIISHSLIESDFYELPIHSGSVDQVILPHTLEIAENPRKLLSEACRIVKPEGYIYIIGFNPYGIWGLKKYFARHLAIPWTRPFISASTIKKWLLLADFELKKQETVLFRPAIKSILWYEKLKFLEWIGNKWYKPFGGAYLLQAQAKVVPLSPIRLHWTQELSGIRVSATGFPDPSTRNHS